MDFRFTPEQEALKKESEDFFRDEMRKVQRLGGGYSVYASDAEKMQIKAYLGGSQLGDFRCSQKKASSSS